MSPTLSSFIRTIPDYPKPGILFRDVTGLLEDARRLRMAVDLIVHRYIDRPIDVVAREPRFSFALREFPGH